MFRRSSKRAVSSTRQTACFPSSAVLTSDGERRRRARRSGRRCPSARRPSGRARPRRTPRRWSSKASYGWWTSMSRRRIRASRPSAARVTNGRRVTGRQGLSFSSGRSIAVELRAARARPSGERRRVDLVGRDLQLAREDVDELGATRRRRPRAERRRRTGAAASWSLDSLEQVVGVGREREVGIACDPEDGRAPRSRTAPTTSARKCTIASSTGTCVPRTRRRRTAGGRRAR